jgi:hypothetical protein
MGSHLSAIPVVAALLFIPSVARASMIYLDLIRQQLGVSCAPACTICHNNPNGGTGSVTTPFGREMMGLGLVAESPASLKQALDQLKAQNLSAIGDGVPDIQALASCMDPNVAPINIGSDDGGGGGEGGSVASGYTLPPTPGYGCAVGLGGPGGASASLLLLAAVILVRRRGRGAEV